MFNNTGIIFLWMYGGYSKSVGAGDSITYIVNFPVIPIKKVLSYFVTARSPMSLVAKVSDVTTSNITISVKNLVNSAHTYVGTTCLIIAI